MKRFLTSIIVFFMLCASYSCQNDKDSKEVAEEKNEQNATSEKMEDDHEFAVDAVSGGIMEVTLGNVALKNAASEKVKEFGQTIIDDHTKANGTLMALAAQKGITLPTSAGDKHQEHINDLSKKQGADFDKEYMNMMVDDHEEDIRKFEEEAKNGKDSDLRNFAADQVPILKKHLEAARSIRDSLQ